MNILEDIRARRPAALLFDWDGTLVDSQEGNYCAVRDALATIGVGIERGWFEARTGLSARDLFGERLADRPEIGDATLDRLTELRDALFMRNAHDLRTFPDSVAIIEHFHGAVPIAIASGGSRTVIRPLLDGMPFRHMIDALVTREDVAHGKPYPDLFLAAAKRLGVPAAGCVVFEDSAEGLQAAASAGMHAYDVRRFDDRPNPHHATTNAGAT